jgi:uncharacterized protein (TIGR02588 family)
MSDHSPRTAAEWTALVVSSLVLAAVIGLILVQMRGSTDPAAPVAVVADDVRQVGDRHHVDVTVTNEGDETAANVQVSAELTVDGEVVTTADQTIDFLAGAEEDDLVFVFDDDPADGELTVAVTGFERP